MAERKGDITTANPWSHLRRLTPARIALGRSGISVPTSEHLAFQLAHAQARSAVHHHLDTARLGSELTKRWGEVLHVRSQAHDRATYLQRPDLGRRLDPAALEHLKPPPDGGYDLAIVIAEGLSALAIERNTVPFLETFMPHAVREGWRVAPLVIAEQGRVALGDEIGSALGARLAVMLIGERPGLSSPDSLGIYVTYAPRAGRTDAERNCISNVRREGMSYEEGAYKLHYLVTEALRRALTGVDLKDEAEALPSTAAPARNFLIDGPV